MLSNTPEINFLILSLKNMRDPVGDVVEKGFAL
jgi:hypothetical protein